MFAANWLLLQVGANKDDGTLPSEKRLSWTTAQSFSTSGEGHMTASTCVSGFISWVLLLLGLMLLRLLMLLLLGLLVLVPLRLLRLLLNCSIFRTNCCAIIAFGAFVVFVVVAGVGAADVARFVDDVVAAVAAAAAAAAHDAASECESAGHRV